MSDNRRWVWLMVGGPWHGTFKSFTFQVEGRHVPRDFHVPNPPVMTVYRRAADFGIPDPYEGHTWYYRRMFDIHQRGERTTYIDLLLKRGMDTNDLGLLVWDAYQMACTKLAKEGYRWE
jgi:hypothetical protein